jgi:hypothetical protein
VVVLKGFSLAYQSYNSPTVRPRTDVDILILPSDKEKVLEIFNELDYYNPRGWEPQAISNEFSMKKTLGKGVNVLFDVHLKISNSKQIENILNYNELLNSANKTVIPELNLINKPYALVHAIVHLLHHKSHDDMIKLIWYYDIYLLINQFCPEQLQQAKSIIIDKKLVKVCLACVNLTKHYFTSPSVDAFILWCNQPEVFTHQSEKLNDLLKNSAGIKGLWVTIKNTEGVLNKWNIVKETAFPPAAEIYSKYGRDSRWPLSLLYIRRIFTGSIKYIFKQRKQ